MLVGRTEPMTFGFSPSGKRPVRGKPLNCLVAGTGFEPYEPVFNALRGLTGTASSGRTNGADHSAARCTFGMRRRPAGSSHRSPT